MGVDAKIYLPSNTRLDTVVDVACRLLGAPVEKKDLGSRDHPGAWSAQPANGVVSYRSYESVPGMAGVTIKKIDFRIYGQPAVSFCYHFEFGGPRRGKNNGGSRGIMMRAYGVNIAMFKRLADFFGGTVDYCDCDDKENNYVVPHKDDNMNCPEDGKPWQTLQERIMDVQPLTESEIEAGEKVASYHETEEDREKRLNKPAPVTASKERYTVVSSPDAYFWVMDNESQRRMRPDRGDATEWHTEEEAKAQARRLNRKAARQ